MQKSPNKHWRSLDELNGSPEFQEQLSKEFLGENFDASIDELDGVSRRRFLQVMGASVALAGAASCRWEAENIVPLASRPANRIPGKAQHYSSALDFAGYGHGVVLTSYDGRPVKVEGNELDPNSMGATNVFAQAAILEMYDPDRSRMPIHAGKEVSFDAFRSAFAGLLDSVVRPAAGRGLAILSEANSSPTAAMLRERVLAELPEARFVEYEAVSRDNEIEGARLAFGDAHRAHYKIGAAKIIVSLDADLFSNHPAQLRHNREWAAGRRPVKGEMSRLYVAESRHTIDGGMADHRIPMRSGDVGAFLALIEASLAKEYNMALASNGVSMDAVPAAHAATDAKARTMAKAIAADLASHTGRSLLVAGPNQPADVHERVHQINGLLGNLGRTVTFTNEPNAARPRHEAGLKALVQAINEGRITALIIMGGNPVYTAPASMDFAAALAKVEHNVHFSEYANETAAHCGWHVPRAHAFEAWTDALGWDGTHLIGQPGIAPIWGALSTIEFLHLMLPANEAKPMDLVAKVAGVSGKAWQTAVHDGKTANKVLTATTPRLNAPKVFSPSVAGEGMEVTFAPDTKVWDGRFANSAWLQELPEFMSKLTWDNVAMLAPATADKLGVTTGDWIKVTVDGVSLDIPAYAMPGQARDSVALAFGYGRTHAGVVGGNAEVDSVGVNVYPLRKAGVHQSKGEVQKGNGSFPLAITQTHHLMDARGMSGVKERLGALVREEGLEHYDPADKEHFRHQVHHPKLLSLWEERSHDGYAWGMSIDLNVCTGCNACVIACQSENNIPVVGKEQVINGREMHWMRLDRYFAGDDANDPQLATQPVNCQQCENAPCEQVCPVAATMHSDEGLNDMVYNRCVGTRYCANNCPYKVRHFNYLNFHKELKDPNNEVAKLALNPEVTVRSRGVMEKCTYCVQRISEKRITAKNEGRKLRDGEVTTACAQVCPTTAIVFGDKADPESRVSKLHEDARAYELLAELNTKPRNNFLAKIRNPHPDLAPVASADDHNSSNGGH